MTIAESIQRLEQQKSAILAEVGGWPAELQMWRPPDGGWSGLQVLDHIVRMEAGICGAVAKRLGRPARIRLRDRAGVAFVDLVFQSKRRVKVPASVAKVITPGESLELGEIAERWERCRVELAQLVCEAEGCRGGVFKHPVGGWMSFGQVLRLFSVHMVHHEFQLERIRTESCR
jgi:hypothetical protein